MDTKLDIITIGESLIEFSCDENLTYAQTLNKYYGGDTLCSAVAASRLGAKVGYITKVGLDPFKDYLLESWQSEGLDISRVKPVKGYNGIYFISRPTDSEKEFMQYRRKTAATYIDIDDIDEEYIKNAGIFYTTGIVQSLSLNTKEAVQKAYSIAKENNLICAYDTNYSDSIWSIDDAKNALNEIVDYLDIIFINQTRDGETLFGIESHEKLIKMFWDMGIPIVSVRSSKDGGCYTGENGNIIFEPYRYTDIVDATSSGDAYNGAFLYAISKSMSAFEATKVGVVTASIQTQDVGAIKSIPYKDAVDKELNK